jgi:hypothetical protein
MLSRVLCPFTCMFMRIVMSHWCTGSLLRRSFVRTLGCRTRPAQHYSHLSSKSSARACARAVRPSTFGRSLVVVLRHSVTSGARPVGAGSAGAGGASLRVCTDRRVDRDRIVLGCESRCSSFRCVVRHDTSVSSHLQVISRSDSYVRSPLAQWRRRLLRYWTSTRSS